MGSSLTNCSICMFETPPEDPVQFLETNIVTVMNGQAICLYHARKFPAGGEWRRMYDTLVGNAPTEVIRS